MNAKNNIMDLDNEKRVLFLYTTSDYIYLKIEQPSKESYYPIGIGYLQSYLESLGFVTESHSASYCDYEEGFRKMDKLIREFKPHIIGLQILTSIRLTSFKMIEYVHRNYPDIKLVVGGIHTTAMYESMLEKYPYLTAVIGEGEITFGELAEAFFQEDADFEKIDGIAFNRNGSVITTNPRALIENLDDLPFPKHEAFCRTPRGVGPIITTRGCPFKCTFCATMPLLKNKIRFRSIKNVVDEIEYMINTFPQISHIWILDDTLFLDNQRVIDLCDEIIRRGIKMAFSCSGRVKPLSVEMIKKLEQANFTNVYLGLESGNPEILKRCNKGITPQDALNAFEMFAREAPSIYVYAFLMVGLQGETRETILETARFVKKLQRISYYRYDYLSIVMIYAGTELYEITKAHNQIDDSFWFEDKPVPHFTVENDLKVLKKYRKLLMSHVCYNSLFTFSGFINQFTMLPYIWRHFRKNGYSLWGLFFKTVLPKRLWNFLSQINKKRLPVIKENYAFELGFKWNQLLDGGIKKVFLFGGGEHTNWLLRYFKPLAGPKIMAILDDNAGKIDSIDEIKVVKPEEVSLNEIDAIVLSTDRHQVNFAKRCKQLYGDSIPLVDLYKDF
jgi:radical SAM superfamily enzyme YgiQ (UPF0313 family)